MITDEHLEEFLIFIVRILHEKKGHFNRRVIRDNGLIFIDSFEFKESGFYFENIFCE